METTEQKAPMGQGELLLEAEDRVAIAHAKSIEVTALSQAIATGELDILEARNAVEGLSIILRSMSDDLFVAEESLNKARAMDGAEARP